MPEARLHRIAADAPDDVAGLERAIAANRLDRLPRLGRPGSESGTRQLVVPGTPYKIFYRIIGHDEVELLRVLHGARKWPP